jgi:hypothetical protein
MKLARWIAVAIAIASALPAPVHAASGGPIMLVYRASGVIDDGGASGTGSATAVHCTNFSTANEDVVFVVRQINGVIVGFAQVTLTPLRTWTAVTHHAVSYGENSNLLTGIVAQGVFAVGSTTTSVICSAMSMDASTPTPQGISLHMVRYNSDPGSTE